MSSLSCANSIYGGEWVRVRHIPAESTTWHPATDSLAGTEEYGIESDDSAPWSVNFASKVPAGCSYNEFLFATGDCAKWLVATTDAVIGEVYDNADRPIIASSDGSNYVAKWYNRGDLKVEDPWVSIVDHNIAIAQGKIVYGEGSNINYKNSFQSNSGADVYVRSDCEQPSSEPSSQPAKRPRQGSSSIGRDKSNDKKNKKSKSSKPKRRRERVKKSGKRKLDEIVI